MRFKRPKPDCPCLILALKTGPEKSDCENGDNEDKTSEEVIVIG